MRGGNRNIARGPRKRICTNGRSKRPSKSESGRQCHTTLLWTGSLGFRVSFGFTQRISSVRKVPALMLVSGVSNPRVAPVTFHSQVRGKLNRGGVMATRRVSHGLLTRLCASRSTLPSRASAPQQLIFAPAATRVFGALHRRTFEPKGNQRFSITTAAGASETDTDSVPFSELSDIHPSVVSALHRLGFENGTFIQSQALPLINSGSDVVVAAETGSGKTLSYLVPIFSNLLANGHGANSHGDDGAMDSDTSSKTKGRVGALILAPNAILVNQVAAVASSLVGDDGEQLLRVAALTPDKALPIRDVPDIIVATPARAVEDVCRFSEGAWRRGAFSKHVPFIRTVVFDEADQLLSGGYLRPVRGIFDVLYREEKLAALGLTVAVEEEAAGGDGSTSDDELEWQGDEGRTPDKSYSKDWRDDHKEDVNKVKAQIASKGKGPALGGKGLVGVGSGREFRRQYVFAAATVMCSGKKTPGAMIKYGFPDAKWIEGRRLHRAVETVVQKWINVSDDSRADALGVALGLGDDASESNKSAKTMVFVNSGAACDDVTFELKRQGFKAEAFSADVSPEDRQVVLRKFSVNEINVLVCTDAAARGVDVPEVVHVVQAEFAGNAVEYLHRIGRTARCGAAGRVTNLVGAKDEELIAAIRLCEENGQPVESAFSRKRSFRKKYKKYGESRTAPQNRK